MAPALALNGRRTVAGLLVWVTAACGAPGRADGGGSGRPGETLPDAASRCTQASAALASPSTDAALLQRQIADAALSCSEACDGGDERSCASLAMHVTGICVRHGAACRAICTRAQSASLRRSACGLAHELAASIERMNEGVEAYGRGDFTAAESRFAEATELSEQNHNAWYDLGQAREKLGKDAQAAAAYAQAALLADDDPMYHYRYGKALVGGGCEVSQTSDLARARKHLERAVELEPRLYRAWDCLGVVYASGDHPGQAAEAWTRAARLNPAFDRPFILLGKLYIRWRKLAEASKVLSEGARTVPPVARVDIWYHLGLAYQQQGKNADAIQAYSAALELAPDTAHVLLQRGLLFDDMGDHKRAKRDLEAFVKAGGTGSPFELQAAQERLLQMKARGR